MIKWFIRQFTISKLANEILKDININYKERKKTEMINYYYRGEYSISPERNIFINRNNSFKWHKTTLLERLLFKIILKKILIK